MGGDGSWAPQSCHLIFNLLYPSFSDLSKHRSLTLAFVCTVCQETSVLLSVPRAPSRDCVSSWFRLYIPLLKNILSMIQVRLLINRRVYFLLSLMLWLIFLQSKKLAFISQWCWEPFLSVVFCKAFLLGVTSVSFIWYSWDQKHF